MKVQDLVEKLLSIDPELEVFASPLVDMEIGTLGKQDPDAMTKTGRVPDPFSNFPVRNVSQIRMMVGDRSEYVVIAFDQENPHVENTEEKDTGESIH